MKQQNQVKFWLLQILPPVLLLYLCWIPIDLGPSILWIPGLCAFIGSVLTLLKNVVSAIVRGDKGRIYAMTRPVLTIAVVIFSLYAVTRSYKVAVKEATVEAEKIQKACNSKGICPSEVEGWRETWKGYSSITRTFGAQVKYAATYRRIDNARGFEIYLRENIDHGCIIKGGVGKITESTCRK